MRTIEVLKREMRGCHQNTAAGRARLRALGALLKESQNDLEPRLHDAEVLSRNAKKLKSKYAKVASVTQSKDFEEMTRSLSPYEVIPIGVDRIEAAISYLDPLTYQSAVEELNNEPWFDRCTIANVQEAVKRAEMASMEKEFLVPISVDQVINLVETGKFPTVGEYLDKKIYGDIYYRPEYQWFAYFLPKSDVVDFIMCTIPNRFLVNSGHLSVLEVNIDFRGQGRGKKGIEVFERLFPSASAYTLVARQPSLVNYYEKLGYVQNGDHMVKK
jgi:hypothetical protein